MSVTRHLQLIVPGEPCGKGRPRFVRSTGHAFTPKKTEGAESTIRLLFAQAYPNFVPLTESLKMVVLAYMGIPKSASRKSRAEMLAQTVWPTKRPDADNVIKLVCDSLNGIAYRDDSQIVSAVCHKVYSDRPRLEINIIPKEDDRA